MSRLRHLTIAGAVIATTLALTLSLPAGSGAATQKKTYTTIRPSCALVEKADRAHCDMKLIANLKRVPRAAAAPTSGYGPADLRSAYGLPSSGGAGQTVAIVDAFGDNTAEADLNTYRSNYGLPACTTANGCFKKVNQSGVQGSYPANNVGWALETQLDLQMVSAICPGCKILLVEATNNQNQSLYAAEDTAARLGAKVISNSYGGGEASSETSDDTHFNHPGVAITVSSGDAGFGVEYPAASRYVTAVGGTTLSKASNSRGWTETAWSGSGSGCSAYEPKPAWQADSGCARRTVADVSAVADPNTGVAVYDSNCSLLGQLLGQCFKGWGVVGGTSASAPIIAGVYALAGNASSVNYGSFPYGHTSSLFDVTSGSNGSCSPAYLCTSGAGYDGPTGLGTPQGTGAF
ncbi:MAG TPA: S53 family peptidase [Solirubrobacterales bacterium]|jgi:subtilase family serine protease